MEALESFMWMWPSRRNLPEFQMGLRFDVASDQFSAQQYGFDINCDWTQDPKSRYIQSVMSTFPLYHRGTQINDRDMDLPEKLPCFSMFQLEMEAQALRPKRCYCADYVPRVTRVPLNFWSHNVKSNTKNEAWSKWKSLENQT